VGMLATFFCIGQGLAITFESEERYWANLSVIITKLFDALVFCLITQQIRSLLLEL